VLQAAHPDLPPLQILEQQIQQPKQRGRKKEAEKQAAVADQKKDDGS
jgi:hypothetical protein